MAYSVVPTVTTGDTWSAANHNTYIKDNFAAGVPDIFTAAGQLVYGTATNAASILSIGDVGQILTPTSDGALPEWGSALIHEHQGGSSTDYTATGTTNHSLTNAKAIIGVTTVTFSGTSGTSPEIVFPTAFNKVPQVFIQPVDTHGLALNGRILGWTIQDTTTQHTYILASCSVSLSTSSYVFYWLAIGE